MRVFHLLLPKPEDGGELEDVVRQDVGATVNMINKMYPASKSFPFIMGGGTPTGELMRRNIPIQSTFEAASCQKTLSALQQKPLVQLQITTEVQPGPPPAAHVLER